MRRASIPYDVSNFDGVVADPSRLVREQVEYRLMMADGLIKHVTISRHRVDDGGGRRTIRGRDS